MRSSSPGDPLIAKAMLSASGQLVPIQLLPWRRAYRMDLSRENTIIFSLVRSPERESFFHWMGPVHSLNGYLIALSTWDDIQLNTLDDANRAPNRHHIRVLHGKLPT